MVESNLADTVRGRVQESCGNPETITVITSLPDSTSLMWRLIVHAIHRNSPVIQRDVAINRSFIKDQEGCVLIYAVVSQIRMSYTS